MKEDSKFAQDIWKSVNILIWAWFFPIIITACFAPFSFSDYW
jgi:hypothetical protein